MDIQIYSSVLRKTTSHRLVLLHVCTVSLKSLKIHLFFVSACFTFSYLLQSSAKSQIKFLSCLWRTCHEPYRTGLILLCIILTGKEEERDP